MSALGHEFKLSDADGKEHAYFCAPHGATEGEAVVYRLGELLAEPLGALLSGAEGVDLKDLDPAALLDQIDPEALGRAVRAALKGGEVAGLRAAVLKHTTRDGKRLNDAATFDPAYARNYGELLRAVFEVARYNRFFPGLSTP